MPKNRFMQAYFLITGIFTIFYMVLGFLDRHMGNVPGILLKIDHFLALSFVMVIIAICIGTISGNSSAVQALRRVKAIIHRPSFYLLLVFFLVIALNAVLTEREQPGTFSDNRGCLYDVWAVTFILFPMGICLGKGEKHQLLLNVLTAFVLIYPLFILYGFLALLFPETLGVEGIYMYKFRIYLFSNPNTLAMIISCMLLLSIPIFLAGKRWMRILVSGCCVIYYVALIFTESRASMIAVSICLGIAAICMEVKAKGSHLKRILASAGVILLLLVLFAGGRKLFIPARIALSEISSGKTATEINSESIGQIREEETNKLNRPLMEKGLNDREQTWQVVFKALKTNPHYALHGCSPNEIPKLVEPYVGEALYTHNQLLEIAMSYGLPALAVFLVWLVVVAGNSMKVGLAPFSDALPFSVSLMPLILLELVINNVTEGVLLFYRFPVGHLFFLIAGYVTGVACTVKRESRSPFANANR